MSDRTSNVRVNVRMDSSGAISGALGIGKAVGGAALAVGALVAGVAIGANKLYSFGDSLDDANVSIEQGLKTMKLFGKATGDVAARVEAQGEAVSRATGIDQVSIKTTQAKLLTFKELAKTADQTGGNFDRATQAAVDLAAKGFGTAETNAVQLGKALNDPVKGLTSLGRAGITFTDQEKERIKTLVESNKLGEAQSMVLKAIESQVGGTAEATAGGFEKMKNNVKIFGQELALKALPYLDQFGNFMINTGGPALERFGAAAAEVVVPALQKMGNFLIEKGVPAAKRLGVVFQEQVVPALRRFGTFVQEQVVPALIEFAGFVQDHVVPIIEQYLAKGLQRAKDLFDQVRGSVKKNQPELEDMFAKFKKVATFIVDKVGPVVADLATAGLPVLGAAISGAISYVSAMWDGLNRLWDIAKKVAATIGDLKDKLASLPGAGALGGLLRTSSTGSLGALPDALTHSPAARNEVHVHLEGTTFVGDEMQLARKLEAVLSGNRRVFGPVLT